MDDPAITAALDAAIGPEPDWEAFNMDDLQREMVRLAKLLVPIQNRRQQVIELMERRKREAMARARLRGLSEGHKDALRTVLKK
jgi:hypothetical protein